MKRLLATLMLFSLIVGVIAQVADDVPRKRIFLPKSPKQAAYMLMLQSNAELVKIVRSEPVYIAMLQRAGLDRKWREEAAVGLAELHATDPLDELLDGIARVAASTGGDAERVLRDLADMLLESPHEQLHTRTNRLVELAGHENPLASQIGLAALVTVEGDAEKVAQHQIKVLVNLLQSVALIKDDAARETFFDLAQALWTSDNTEIRQAATTAASYISGREAPTLDYLNSAIASNADIPVAMDALARLPLQRWPANMPRRIAATLTDFLRRTPASNRTVSPAKEGMALAKQIAASLPPGQSAKLLERLASLSVAQYRIRAPYEQMAFEPDVLIVAAGKTMEIIFTNEDDKPHNFLLAEPGSFEEVGLAAQALATTLAGQAKHYVPDDVGVLQATPLVWPEKEARLFFKAPTKPGVYPYICTFPGHWLKMVGALVVVEDVEVYVAKNNPLPTANELLGKKMVKQWSHADLAADAAQLGGETRSFENGRRLFAKVSCVSCHKLGTEGRLTANIGPDLTEIAKKYPQPGDMLREIVEPSHSIEDKYASVILVVNGKAIKGVVVQRTETEVVLKENPLIDCEPTVVSLEEVEDEEKSKLSPMPAGLLNTLERDEILDLMAYIYSGGDTAHAFFK